VLASIPNIRNLTILEQLAQGDFPYADSGLLDITHIRFFTWQGVQRLFGETGYRIDAVVRSLDSRHQSLYGALQQRSSVMSIRRSCRSRTRRPTSYPSWLRCSSG
jgi:hypothetical protein